MRSLFGSIIFAASLLVSGLAIAEEQTVTLSVSGMTCASCPYIVRESLAAVDGVTTVEVSFWDGRATVTYDASKCSVADLTDATEEYGFPSAQIGVGG